jgi:ElaB/YqjD/DUF883 family membrane-anchored ribosome-binding protein
MNADKADKQVVALQADDSIDKALAELDSRLSAWLSAVQAGQAALLNAADRIVGDKPAQSSGPRGAAKLFEGQVPGLAPEHDRQMPALRPASEDGVPTMTEEDEALLASLDAETANLVRVKRRLAGNRRSVRELLEELRLGPP